MLLYQVPAVPPENEAYMPAPAQRIDPLPRKRLVRENGPLYRQLVDELRNLISSGQLEVGSDLPKEAEIGERLGVSLITVRRALKELEDLGMVRKRVDRDAAAVGHLLRFLRHRSIAHQWLLFEEVYASDGNVAARARALAAGLGIDLPADHPELSAFSGSSGQSSGDILPFLPNADALSALLDEICPS